jgi:hypothetical protein
MEVLAPCPHCGGPTRVVAPDLEEPRPMIECGWCPFEVPAIADHRDIPRVVAEYRRLRASGEVPGDG